MLDLKSAFPAFVEARKVGFNRDRSKTVGSSEIGACARRIVYEKRLGSKGYDKGYVDGGGYAVRGDILEDNLLVPLLQTALKGQCPQASLIWAGQKEQRSLEAEPWKLSATPDGLIVNTPRHFLAKYGVSDTFSDCVSVEGKSFDPRKNTNEFPLQAHVDQLNVAMGLIRAEGKYQPLWGIIVYVNASDVSDIHVKPVRFDQNVFDDQKRRAIALMSAENPLLIRPEGKIAGGKECEFCPFQERCTGYSHVVPKQKLEFEKLAHGDRVAIMSAVGTLTNVDRQIADLEVRREEARSVIKELLTKNDTYHASGKLKDGRMFEIRWRKTNGRTTYDTAGLLDAFRELGGNPDDYAKKSKGGESLTVKFIEKEETKDVPANA
jgi:hypothetical protein